MSVHASFLLSLALAASDPAPADVTPDVRAQLRALEHGFADVARRALPSVVTVRAYRRNDASAPRDPVLGEIGWSGEAPNQSYFGYELANACSGFVIDATGEILTCNHALQKPDGSFADLIDVETHDGARILVEAIGSEPTVNFAILRCAVFPAGHSGKLEPLRFGDSDALRCGQWVFGAGDPAGPERFFAAGTFIAKPSRECYQDYLSAFYSQSALTVPPQAYGGPLLDLDGNVVGILAPRGFAPGSRGDAPRTGIEFALPSEIVSNLRDAIGKARSFRSPWLGFSVMSRAEIAAARGVEAFNALPKPKNGILVESVFTPSPASAAGIRPGDFLVGFDAYRVFAPVDFQRYLYLAGIGTRVKLELFRDGEVLHKEIVVELRPAEAAPR